MPVRQNGGSTPRVVSVPESKPTCCASSIRVWSGAFSIIRRTYASFESLHCSLEGSENCLSVTSISGYSSLASRSAISVMSFSRCEGDSDIVNFNDASRIADGYRAKLIDIYLMASMLYKPKSRSWRPALVRFRSSRSSLRLLRVKLNYLTCIDYIQFIFSASQSRFIYSD